MIVQIYSREDIQSVIEQGKFPENTAVISFCDRGTEPCDRVNYSGVCDRVMYIELDDIDFSDLSEYGLTYDMFFPEADDAACFILDAYANGMNIICQCEYGESRSAGCAAAVLEYFYSNGLDIFSDYKYYPNKLIYHKVLEELHEQGKRVELHAHTYMSMMKGLSSAGELISWAVEDGQPALAITDVNTVQAFPEANLSAEEQPYQLKIIYGMEGVLSDALYENSTVVILAKNPVGLKNLYKLVTISHLENAEHPCFSKETLSELREGLIIGSGSESGELFRAIEDERPDKEIIEIAKYYDYLEICPSMPPIKTYTICQVGWDLDIPVCATGNVCFTFCANEMIYRSVANDNSVYFNRYKASGLHFRDTDEMREVFDYLGKDTAYKVVVTNTNRIANSIEYMRVYPCKVPPIIISDERWDGGICIGRIETLTESEAVERMEEYEKKYSPDWLNEEAEFFAEMLEGIKKSTVSSEKYLNFPEGYDIEALTPLQYSSDGKTIVTHFDLPFFELAVKTADDAHRQHGWNQSAPRRYL